MGYLTQFTHCLRFPITSTQYNKQAKSQVTCSSLYMPPQLEVMQYHALRVTTLSLHLNCSHAHIVGLQSLEGKCHGAEGACIS